MHEISSKPKVFYNELASGCKLWKAPDKSYVKFFQKKKKMVKKAIFAFKKIITNWQQICFFNGEKRVFKKGWRFKVKNSTAIVYRGFLYFFLCGRNLPSAS